MKEKKLNNEKNTVTSCCWDEKKMLLHYECMIIWPHQNPIQETFNFQYTQTNTVLKSNDIIKKETNKTKNLISFLCVVFTFKRRDAKPFPWTFLFIEISGRNCIFVFYYQNCCDLLQWALDFPTALFSDR